MTPEQEAEELKAAEEIVAPYLKLVNATPLLLSMLYDIELLPEQITGPVRPELKRINAIRMAGVCEVYKQATLTERARCAKIAREFEDVWSAQSRAIAAAIEKDTSFSIEAGEEG